MSFSHTPLNREDFENIKNYVHDKIKDCCSDVVKNESAADVDRADFKDTVETLLTEFDETVPYQEGVTSFSDVMDFVREWTSESFSLNEEPHGESFYTMFNRFQEYVERSLISDEEHILEEVFSHENNEDTMFSFPDDINEQARYIKEWGHVILPRINMIRDLGGSSLSDEEVFESLRFIYALKVCVIEEYNILCKKFLSGKGELAKVLDEAEKRLKESGEKEPEEKTLLNHLREYQSEI
jgi:hypothetical protein